MASYNSPHKFREDISTPTKMVLQASICHIKWFDVENVEISLHQKKVGIPKLDIFGY